MQTASNYLQEVRRALPLGWNNYWFSPREGSSLSLLRIAVGLVALGLHLTLWVDLKTFFGPHGLVPSEAIPILTDGISPSYLDFVQAPWLLHTLHALGAIVLLLFTLGLFTSITSVLALIVLLATVHRAPILAGQSEWILAFSMAYLCIGKSGGSYSLDAILSRDKTGIPQLHYRNTLATRLLQLHTMMVYALIALAMLTTPKQVWLNGEAMWYIVAMPHGPLYDFRAIAEHEYILNFWTHAVLVYMVAFPLLIWNRWTRPIAIVWGGIHWFLIGLATGLVGFCCLMFALNLVFLPVEKKVQE